MSAIEDKGYFNPKGDTQPFAKEDSRRYPREIKKTSESGHFDATDTLAETTVDNLPAVPVNESADEVAEVSQ